MDVIVEEPVIGEHYNFTLEPPHAKDDCVLNEQAAETLRAEEERALLGDIFVGGDIDDLEFDDTIDFSTLMDSEEDTPIGGGGGATAVMTGSAQLLDDVDSPLSTADATGGGLLAGSGGKMADAKSSLNNEYDEESLSKHTLNAQMEQNDHRQRAMQQAFRQQRDSSGALVVGSVAPSAATVSSSDVANRPGVAAAAAGAGAEKINVATERWEDDEPLGDKATKAAVLYANVMLPGKCRQNLQFAVRLYARKLPHRCSDEQSYMRPETLKVFLLVT